VFDHLISHCSRNEMKQCLATLLMNKGIALHELGDLRATIAQFDRAVQIWTEMVTAEKRTDVEADLAKVLAYRACALDSAGDKTKSKEEARKVLPLLIDQTVKTRRPDLVAILRWIEQQAQ
jgi:hypothetical protein